MDTLFTYKGYTGSVAFSADDGVYFGKITDIRDVVTFEADDLTSLKIVFEQSVDDYITNLSA